MPQPSPKNDFGIQNICISNRYITITYISIAVILASVIIALSLMKYGRLLVKWSNHLFKDGATSHTTKENMDFLAKWVGPEKIISNKSARLIWSPMSPDLNPLDYFVWNELKRFVGKKNPKIKAEIIEAVGEYFNQMPQNHIDECILGKLDEQGCRVGGFLSRLNTVFILDGDSVQKVKRSTRRNIPDIPYEYLVENHYFDEDFDRDIPDIAEDFDEEEGEFGEYEDYFTED